MREIAITEIANIKIGHAQDHQSATGCTVLICKDGAPAGIDIRGGGAAGRETDLLNPISAAQKIHAVLLSGGSAFGLDATGGVMRYLEERGIGFDTSVAKVPLVCTSCIFDLGIGSATKRPDQDMAYQACLDAENNQPGQGNIGVGTGATVGKYHGPEYMMKSGLGIYAVQIGQLQIAAIMAVNALGDVYHSPKRKILAGLLNKGKTTFANTEKLMFKNITTPKSLFTNNTTIGAIITNAACNKAELTKIASMAQNGMARAISPVHTMADGDSIYALSVGDITADINALGTLAAHVTQQAIIKAALSAQPAYGLKTATCMMKNKPQC